MKKRIAWLVVSCVMALSLILASCAPAVTEEKEVAPAEKAVVAEEKVVEKAATGVEVPQYGGTLTFIFSEGQGFDPVYTSGSRIYPAILGITNEEMLEGDWTKGPAGTGETDWQSGYLGRIGLLRGWLAESYEMPDNETVIYHIRKGVKWWNKPPLNGRELTASDVAWSFNREWEAPSNWLYTQMLPGQRPLSFKALDRYTVEAKFPPAVYGTLFILTSGQLHIYAPEVVAQYGDYKDWRNQAGTGPFILTDYVSGSSYTLKRNPDYWKKDPFHPENQLPYVDTVKHLIISDKATQLAALRTGKIDLSLGASAITWEDKDSLVKTAPELKYLKIAGSSKQLWGRTDKPLLPFKDIRVRQALNLAVNKLEIVEKLYRGNADILGHPYPPYKSWAPLYTPLEQMPAAVQELYTYNPDKAKQLLAEAGYPNGFKTEVITGLPEEADFLSLIKEYFAKVGVTLEIKLLEQSVYGSVQRGRTHEQMIYGGGSQEASFPWKMNTLRPEMVDSWSFYESERVRAAYNEVNLYVGRSEADDAKWMKVLKDVAPFWLEEASGVWLPVPHQYRFWWPWLKNYQGEGAMGYDEKIGAAPYVWIDQALKKSMGY